MQMKVKYSLYRSTLRDKFFVLGEEKGIFFLLLLFFIFLLG